MLLLHGYAGLRVQYGMRTTPKSLRPPEASKMHDEAGMSLASPLQTPSQLSRAALTPTRSPASMSLVDAWDASMTHHHDSSQNSSPTALLMGPSPERPSITVSSPDKAHTSKQQQDGLSPDHHFRARTSPDMGHIGQVGSQRMQVPYAADWNEADDGVVMGEDEPSGASENGSSMRFECHHDMCHHSPARGSVTTASVTSSPVGRSHAGNSSERRPEPSPPIVLTSSPMRTSPLSRDATPPRSSQNTASITRGSLSTRVPDARADNGHPAQHAQEGYPGESWTDRQNPSVVDRSFVISEGRQELAGSTSIIPRDGGPSSQPAFSQSAGSSGSWDFSKRLNQSHVSSVPTSSMRPAAVNVPHLVSQDDLPQGSPLSRSSSGPLAGRPVIASSTSTSCPSDLSSPETDTVHNTADLPLHCKAGQTSSMIDTDGEALDLATDEATSRPPADASAGSALSGDDFAEFSISAVHTSPQRGSPAQGDAVVWRSGISALECASKGHPNQPFSPMPSPHAQQPSLAQSPSISSSHSRTPILSATSNPKTPWTVFQTPHSGNNDTAMLPMSSSKGNASGGSTGGSNARPETSIYATPAATGMGSVNKTAGSQTPKARRFETGLEEEPQGSQWRDLFDGYDSELASPDVGRQGLDSPINPRSRSVLDSPVQQLDLAARSARDGVETSWAGFNPFFSHS